MQKIDREEFERFFKFAFVGVLNTCVHLGIVVTLVERLAVYSVWANGVAFIGANLFSFWVNSRWSFKKRMSRKLYLRFMFVSLMSLLATLGASALAVWLGWHYLWGVFLTFITLPLVTYFAHRLWTYT